MLYLSKCKNNLFRRIPLTIFIREMVAMKTEKKISENMKMYFSSLGYPESTYAIEISRDNHINGQFINSRIDFAIILNDAIQIIVEIKNKEISSNLKADLLRFDPAIRQAQYYAQNVKAKYFIITDGLSYLWFTTDDDGRPVQISAVKYKDLFIPQQDNINIGESFRYALKRCVQILRQSNTLERVEQELLLLLIAKYYVKKFNSEKYNFSENILEKLKTTLERNLSESKITINFSINEESALECYRILENIDFDLLLSQEAEAAFQDVLGSFFKKTFHKLSEQICESMLALMSFSKEITVLDIWSGSGTSLRLLRERYPQAKITAIFSTTEAWLYSVFLELLANRDIHDINLISQSELLDKKFMINKFGAVNNIIAALPFGHRIETREMLDKSFLYLEDYLIDLSLGLLQIDGRLIALVPEGFLFQGGRRAEFRKYLINNYSLRAIVSLPERALSFTNIKSSVIVIDKTKLFQKVVCMEEISSASFGHSGNEKINHTEIKKVFNKISEYLNGQSNVKEENTIKVISQSDLRENLSVSSYLATQSFDIQSVAPMEKVSAVCCEIRKGRAIRLKKGGENKVLGPASIRALIVDNSSFDQTSEIPENAIYAQENDIVINGIGNYLGAAAIVRDKRIAISQHVYVLTPNSNFVDAEYLAIALNNSVVQEQIKQVATGTVMPSIRISFLKEIFVPLIPLDQQKLIVEAVRKKKSEIKKLTEKLSNLNMELEKVIDTFDIGEDS